MTQLPEIKNLLFDLGGVILDIDFQATQQKFYDMGFPSILLQYPENRNIDLFYKYETGALDTNAFRNEARELTGLTFSDAELDDAWNAMIVAIPQERTALLKILSERYSLYMLSNTSPLHVPVFEKMFADAAGTTMRAVFKNIYYSFEIGCHKPDREAFEYVIEDAVINPQETIFLDDNIHNIKVSQDLGFQAIHIHERTSLMDLGFDL